MSVGSKNNPALRDSQRLFVYCPFCEDKDGVQMAIIKCVPGGMRYVCPKCRGMHSISKKSYMSFRHEWKNIK